MLLVDDRENKKLIHKLTIKLGDADTEKNGQMKVCRLKSADYVLGDWGVEAKEINDLYHSILGHGRSRTIVGQLKDLCQNFDKPMLVVYNTKLKPFIKGNRRPTAKDLAMEKARMNAVIKSFKMTMHQRFPNLHFMQLDTMDDFVEWLETNLRQQKIAKVKPSMLPKRNPIKAKDDRLSVLMLSGISYDQACDLLDHYGSLTIILRKGTKQKEMMEVSGISRKQAKRILALRDVFSKD
jgi:ERCC4-type nuclease